MFVPVLLSCLFVNVQIAKSGNHFICPNNFHLVQCYHKYILLLDFSSCSVLFSLKYMYVLWFSLSPADGGSEYIQEEWFVSGCSETALLCAQPAPWRNQYFYPHSCSSLHCQCKRRRWEWVPCFPCDRHNAHFIHRNIDTLYTETDAHILHLLLLKDLHWQTHNKCFRNILQHACLPTYTRCTCAVDIMYCISAVFLLEHGYCGFCEWLFASWAA